MERVWIGDLEADGLLDAATQIWCGVFKNYDTGEIRKFFPGSHDNYIAAMCAFLDNETDVLVMHNGVGYDWPLLRKLHKYEYKGKKVDTLLISRTQYPERRSPPNCTNKHSPHSVEAWGYRVGRGKPEHEDWSRYSDEMLHRCSEDVEIQCLIFTTLMAEGKGFKWRDAHKLTLKLFERLQMSEEYGWLVDQDQMNAAIKALDRWMGLIDRAVVPYLPVICEIEETKKAGEYGFVSKPFKKNGQYTEQVNKWLAGEGYVVSGPFSRISFRTVSLDSNKETKEFLLKEGWEPKEWNLNDEGERTSPKLSKDDPFEGINGKLGKLVAKRVQCRHRRSTIVGWFNSIRPDGRIPSVVVGLTTTARARHKNIVNVPQMKSFFGKWMRKCFIAKPGWVLVGTDSDACQIRMLAARMGDEQWKEYAINGDKKKGTDLHSIHAKMAELPNREEAKTFFYGVIFGAGDAKTGKIVHGNAQDGARLKKNLFDKLPALKELIDKKTEEWKANAKKRWNKKFNRMEFYDGWIEGLDGRPIYIPNEHQVLVYMIQSDEAIMMSVAYLKFHQWMDKKYKWGDDYGTVCWYHDEFTVECRPEIAEDVGYLAEKSIAWAGEFFNINCPHKGNAQIGKTWWDIH